MRERAANQKQGKRSHASRCATITSAVLSIHPQIAQRFAAIAVRSHGSPGRRIANQSFWDEFNDRTPRFTNILGACSFHRGLHKRTVKPQLDRPIQVDGMSNVNPKRRFYFNRSKAGGRMTFLLESAHWR